jgi:tRNA (guanine-N7-)-methyltransferase
VRLRHKYRLPIWTEQGAAHLLDTHSTTPVNPELWEAYDALDVEIGCGRGAFLQQMATLHPRTFFIGIDRIPLIAARAAAMVAEYQLPNVRIASGDIQDFAPRLGHHFVQTLYLNFSDPWPRRRQAIRRLTHASKLSVYADLLTLEGCLEFKTDNAALFEWSLASFTQAGWTLMDVTHQVLADESQPYAKYIQTDYEKRFRALGTPICYLRAMPPR